MTSSMQACESLGNLSELFTDMLGTDAAAIDAAAPDAAPEDKMADEIKTVIREESAKTRLASMTVAKLSAEKFHTDYSVTWTPPEALEQEVIPTIIKAFRYDARARVIEGMTVWDPDKLYTSETLAEMPSQKDNVDDLISKIKTYVTAEVAGNVDMIMTELEADTTLFSGPSEAATATSVRKSIDSATTETLAIADAASTAANIA